MPSNQKGNHIHILCAPLGEFPLIRISSDLTEAAAILGYAFYMQPMLLPLLHDLPHEDGEGARVLIKSVRIRYLK